MPRWAAQPLVSSDSGRGMPQGGARFAGIRTFTMLGAVAGLCGWLWTNELPAPAAILFAGAVGIIAAAYVAASRQNVDATTEVAALVVMTAGVFAGTGRSAAILGLTDVDALTVSMARGVATTASLNAAALGIAVGVLSNTALKFGVALVFGSACFRRVVGGTLAFMIVWAAAALVLL